MDKQINHNKFHDESKTRTHRMSKLPGDGDLGKSPVKLESCHIFLILSPTYSVIVKTMDDK